MFNGPFWHRNHKFITSMDQFCMAVRHFVLYPSLLLVHCGEYLPKLLYISAVLQVYFHLTYFRQSQTCLRSLDTQRESGVGYVLAVP